MTAIGQPLLAADEIDILQEIMNIAFGQAAADLADVINIYIVLSVPEIQLLSASDLREYIRREAAAYGKVDMVTQNFWGDLKGGAFLVMPVEAGKVLITLLGEENLLDQDSMDSFDLLERETLLEVGNILIGACVGKVSELLGDAVTYTPPSVALEKHPSDAIPEELFDSSCTAVVLKTLFSFKERDVNGFLFLVTSNDSINWIRKALARFMEQYE